MSERISNSSRLLLPAGLIAGSLLLRPTLFGQQYAPIGLAVMLFCILIEQTSLPRIQNHAKTDATYVCILIFWSYCLLLSIYKGESIEDFLYKAYFSAVISTTAFNLILRDEDYNRNAFSFLAKLNAVLGWSISITWLLLQFIDYNTLRYAHLDIVGYDVEGDGAGDLLFPFSFAYGQLTEYGIYRFLGVYRESGIAQLYFAWSLIYLISRKERKAFSAGAAMGLLLCGSTAAMASIATSACAYGLLSKNGSAGFGWKKMLSMGIVIAAIIAALFLPGLGLQDKSETHGDSFSDRDFAVHFALSDFPQNIFGRGLYRESGYANIGINAISYTYFFGFVGLILYISCFVTSIASCPPGKLAITATALSPLFITAIAFQPLIDSPTAFLLLFCRSYGDD